MLAKRPAPKAPGKEPKRQKKVMTLQEKVNLLDMLREGKSIATVSRHYGVNESTVRYIKKNETPIRKTVEAMMCGNAKMVMIVRDKHIVRMESALAVWIMDCRKKNITLDSSIIREKAKKLYLQFSKECRSAPNEEVAGPSAPPRVGFQASLSWLFRFQQRFKLRSLSLAASADMEAAKSYPKTFNKLIKENGYYPEQVFNMDETVLFWKRLPSRSYLMKDVSKAPGCKAHKDRLTLIMCGNAAGFMLKPGLIYKSANPRALKNNINKNVLPVYWMHNAKAWISKPLITNWFLQSFIPQVKEYLSNLCMEFKVLLVLDGAGGHPVNLYYKGVRIEFFPANTFSLLQPMSQGVIRAFKALYTCNIFNHLVTAMLTDNEFSLYGCWRKFSIATCLTIIGQSLNDMKKETVIMCWKKLWPECAKVCKGFSPEEVQNLAINQSVTLAKLLGGVGFEDITKDEVGTLIDGHSNPLTDDDLADLTNWDSDEEDDSSGTEPEKEDDEGLSLKRLSELMRLSRELQEKAEAWDPQRVRSMKFSTAVENVMDTYKSLFVTMKQQRQQLPIIMFLKPVEEAPSKYTAPIETSDEEEMTSSSLS